jgi:serine/threonine protein kinase
MDIGKFSPISYIGGGQFGVVLKVFDSLLNVERALKVVIVQNAKEFIAGINEAQILEKCRHNHIVDIKEIDVYQLYGNNYPCITTEYLMNGSAQNYLENNFVTTRKAVQIITDVLFGLEKAHSQGILHRDIKPGNILFADNGQSKLSDFGLAYGLPHQSFGFAGYNSHLPPEVLERVTQDKVSDLYSTGITFYRLLNNLAKLYLPFANISEWLEALKKEKFPVRIYKPHIPDIVLKISKKAIKAEHGKRYQNCLQFRQALQKVPLAIEWSPLDENTWTGIFGSDTYELIRYSKRAGYCIDYKRNNRRVNNMSIERISNENRAIDLFYNIIKKTTISIN